MPIKIIAPSLVLIVVSVAGAGAAQALEQMNARQLGQACEQASGGTVATAASVCTAYLQGYLSANPHVRMVDGRESNFSERAMRMRAPGGSHSIESLRSSRYCLPGSVDAATLAQQVVAEDSLRDDTPAGVLVMRILDANYSC